MSGVSETIVCRAARRSRVRRQLAAFRNWLQTGNWNAAVSGPIRELPETIRERIVDCPEPELLVRAQWCGYPVREERTADDAGPKAPRRSTAAAAWWLHARLVAAHLCLPRAALRLRSERSHRGLPRRERWRRLYRDALEEETRSEARVAGSVGLGCFMGLTPIWGFQLPAAVLAAHFTGLSKPIAALATQISLPILMPAIFATSLVLGRALTGDPSLVWEQSLAPSDLTAWILGSLVLASLAGTAGAAATYLILRVRQTA
jgi:uncharacterized protein (DUF2062 family)